MASDQFLSEIRLMAFNFAPRGWLMCNGQLLPINQYQALFSLLGTTYGGNGTTNFGLPDLRGRVPIHVDNIANLGQSAGEVGHTLITQEMPIHTHSLMADATTSATSNTATPTGSTVLGQAGGVANPGGPYAVQIYSSSTQSTTLDQHSIGVTGGGQAHENRQPFLVLTFCIATTGVFPSRN
jgi:microcystin-dependent protein